MADIKLGPSGSEVTLPQISWAAGSPPTIQMNWIKIESAAIMADGSMRVGEIAVKREWIIPWNNLTDAEVSTLSALLVLPGVKRFQNNWESATYYNVNIRAFSHNPKLDSYHRAVHRNTATMTIREL